MGNSEARRGSSTVPHHERDKRGLVPAPIPIHLTWAPVGKVKDASDLMLGFLPPNRYSLVWFDRRRKKWFTDDDREALAMTHVMSLPEPPTGKTITHPLLAIAMALGFGSVMFGLGCLVGYSLAQIR